MAPKTNAARLLDQLGICYELRAYEVDPKDLSAESVAAKVGFPLEQTYKTLLARGDKHGVCFAVVAGDAELDLKALARTTHNRQTELVSLKEVQPLTGYVRGGVTALAAKRNYPVVIDELMQLHERVAVSAGQRGLQILIAPKDYLRATEGTFAPISRAAS